MSSRPSSSVVALSISAVFPAYNDGGTIPSMVLRARQALQDHCDDFEIIVTNDGSADYTGEVLESLAEICPELRVIHHPQNRGYGHALRTGFGAATKDLVFYTDGDAQYDPGLLGQLIEHLDDDVDIVNGYKISRNDPWHRIAIGRVYHHLMRLLFGYQIRDVDCDFRLIRKHCFEAVTLTSPDGTLPLEMVKKWTDAGFRFVEVPVPHFHRVYGRSQFFNLPRLLSVVVEIVRLWWKLEVRQAHLYPTEALAQTWLRYGKRFFSEPPLLRRMASLAGIAYLGAGAVVASLQAAIGLLCGSGGSLVSRLIPVAAAGLQTLLTWPLLLLSEFQQAGCDICTTIGSCFP
jgi:glycosyltransferase involved in cell wall biosynthesis